jgi:hypothetical protein
LVTGWAADQWVSDDEERLHAPRSNPFREAAHTGRMRRISGFPAWMKRSDHLRQEFGHSVSDFQR